MAKPISLIILITILIIILFIIVGMIVIRVVDLPYVVDDKTEPAVDVCTLYESVEAQDACQLEKAQSTKDTNVCEYITDINIKTNCINTLQIQSALSSGSVSACFELKVDNEVQGCLFTVIRERGADDQACEGITDQQDLEQCQEILTTLQNPVQP